MSKEKPLVNSRNLSEIIPGKLYLGDHYSSLCVPYTFFEHQGKPVRITHVLNLVNSIRCYYEDSVSPYSQKGDPEKIHYLKIPMQDSESYNLIQHIEQVCDFIEEGEVVLVHCHKGISRSVSCVIGYLIKKNNWSYGEALEFVRKRRPVAYPNPGFRRQLKTYKRQLENNCLQQCD